jgi:hypothetical protein
LHLNRSVILSEGREAAEVEGPAVAPAFAFRPHHHNLGCPRSPGFGDLGNHDPIRPVLSFTTNPKARKRQLAAPQVLGRTARADAIR